MVTTQTMPPVEPTKRRRGRVLLGMLAVVVVWIAAALVVIRPLLPVRPSLRGSPS